MKQQPVNDGKLHGLKLKYILVGDSGPGLSSLRRRFLHNTFLPTTKSTPETFKCESSFIQLENITIEARIWSFNSNKALKNITRPYYIGFDIALLVYDITRRETFIEIQKELKEIQKYEYNRYQDSRNHARYMLIGNKCDLNNIRQVSTIEAEVFANENNMLFIETSAKTGEGVDVV